MDNEQHPEPPPAGPAWAVPPAPADQGPPSPFAPPGPGQSIAPVPPPPAPPVDQLPAYAPAAPTPAKPRRGIARMAVAVVAAVALLAGSAFALVSFARPDGAESPEAAVRQLFDAISAEDAIGVISTLPENERDILRQPLVDVVGELQRLGVLSQFPLEDVPGADIAVTGLTVTSAAIGGRDDLTAVDVTGGTITGKVLPDTVPLGDTVRAIITEDFGEEIDIKAEEDTEDLADAKLRLVTVKDGDGWHVSIAYSIAEAIRNDRGSVPVLGGGPAPVGADSPDGAVTGLARAALDLDAERVIAMLDPSEAKALYEYAPLFLPDARKGRDEVLGEGYEATVHRLDTKVTGEGSVRHVTTTGFDVEIRGDEDQRARVRWDGECFHAEETRRPYKFSRYDGEYDPSDPDGYRPQRGEPETTNSTTCPGKDTPDDAYGTGFGRATADLGLPNGFAPEYTVTVVEVAGRWYVSPTRTILDNVVAGLRKLTPEQLREWGRKIAENAKTPMRFEPVGPIGSEPGGPFGTVPPYPGGTVPPYPGGEIPPYDEYPVPTTSTTTPRPGTPDTRPGATTTVTTVPSRAPGGTKFSSIRQGIGD